MNRSFENGRHDSMRRGAEHEKSSQHGGGPKRHPQWPVSMAGLQAKLKINRIGDAHEQEADRVADAVVRGGAVNEALTPVGGGVAQRTCAACEQEEDDVVQRKEGGGSAPLSSAALSSAMPAVVGLGGGRALGDGVRARMERGIGADFSGVRVHDGADAAERASALNARAYTAGRDIVFGAGEYRPGTSSGDRLLAHELVHVEQQRKGLVDGVQRDDKPKEEKPKYVVDAEALVTPADEEAWKSATVVSVQVHADERESLDVGREFAKGGKGVVLIELKRTGGASTTARCIRVRSGKASLNVDPNRIFPSTESLSGGGPSTGTGEEADDWISPKAAKSCGGAELVDWSKKDVMATAIRDFRKKFIEKIGEVRTAISTARGIKREDVPLFFMHNNDDNGTTTTPGFQSVSAAIYRPQIVDEEAKPKKKSGAGGATKKQDLVEPAEGFQWAADTDDFVFLTSVMDYRAFTGDSVLDALETLAPEGSALRTELDGLRVPTSTRAELEAFRDKMLTDGSIDATTRSTVRAETEAAMIVARLFNVILQKESRVHEIDTRPKKGDAPGVPENETRRENEPEVTTGLKRDGSSSVFFRGSRFFNLETESLKGGESTQTYLTRYRAAAELLLRYIQQTSG